MSEEIKWSTPRGPGRGKSDGLAGTSRSRKGLAAAALVFLAGAGMYWAMRTPGENATGEEETESLETLVDDRPVFPSLELIKRSDSLTVFGKTGVGTSKSSSLGVGFP